MLACDATTCSVRTEVYDGPLALLLYLIRKQGVDVRALRVAPITDAYLAQLALLDSLDLDLAGEFLVMAATLCFLKSRELLPSLPVALDDEEGDPEAIREELIRRLQEYQRYADAAAALGERPWLGRDVFARRPEPVSGPERALVPGVDALGLLEVYYEVLHRHAAPPPVHEVERAGRSVEEMAAWVLDRLRDGPRELSDLLAELPGRPDRVVAFLAALELARLRMLDARQDRHLGPVLLRGLVLPEDADIGVLSGTA